MRQYEYKVDYFSLYLTYIRMIKRESGYSQILELEVERGYLRKCN
jgi:hypothetical protein